MRPGHQRAFPHRNLLDLYQFCDNIFALKPQKNRKITCISAKNTYTAFPLRNSGFVTVRGR
jgi:hypothetical protein